MKVVLFASAMLGGITDAIPLAANMGTEAFEPMYLAQTSQAVPDPATLKLQAAKAMDKDDKK